MALENTQGKGAPLRLADLESLGLSIQLPGGRELVVTADDVIRFLVKDENATRQEAVLYLAFCASRGLNPLEDEAFLIKDNEGEPARIVLGKQGWLKLAQRHPEYEDHRSGVIVRTGDGQAAFREGAFYDEDRETLVGGWCEVYRKGRPPYPKKVLREEYDTGRRVWKTMPALMVEKVAVVQALRESLKDTGLGVVVAEGEAPEDREARERRAFWATARKLGYSDEEVHSTLVVVSLNDWLANGGSYGEALDVLRRHKLEAPLQGTQLKFNDSREVDRWAYEIFHVGPLKVFADLKVSGWDGFGTPARAAVLIQSHYGSPHEASDAPVAVPRSKPGEEASTEREIPGFAPSTRSGVAPSANSGHRLIPSKRQDQAGPPRPAPKPVAPDPDPSCLRSITDLFRVAHRRWGMQPAEVVKALGHINQLDVTESPWECYQRLKVARGEADDPGPGLGADLEAES